MGVLQGYPFKLYRTTLDSFLPVFMTTCSRSLLLILLLLYIICINASEERRDRFPAPPAKIHAGPVFDHTGSVFSSAGSAFSTVGSAFRPACSAFSSVGSAFTPVGSAVKVFHPAFRTIYTVYGAAWYLALPFPIRYHLFYDVFIRSACYFAARYKVVRVDNFLPVLPGE